MNLFYASLTLFFVLGSLLEHFFTYRESHDYFSWPDFKSSLMLMLSAFIVDIGCKIVATYLLFKLHHHCLIQLGYQWWVWVLCYVLWDFIFYIKHYLEHNIRFMWAIHVNHHSSSYMNLSTALRSGVFKASYRYFFWAIPVFIGFPVQIFLILYGIGKLWAFFSHSQKLGKWGFLEKLTITPTHHLLHHSCNEDHLNKNFGETFLFWDKLFGTFKETQMPLVYGIGKEIDPTNYNEVVFHEIYDMIYEFKQARSWKQRFSIVFGRPTTKDVHTIRTIS